jgi:ferredoxin
VLLRAAKDGAGDPLIEEAVRSCPVQAVSVTEE